MPIGIRTGQTLVHIILETRLTPETFTLVAQAALKAGLTTAVEMNPTSRAMTHFGEHK